MQQFFGWMSQVILALALPYFVISMYLGVRVARRHGFTLGSQERGPDHDAVIVARRAVLPRPLPERGDGDRRHRAPSARRAGRSVIVIDDGSSDATAERARQAATECAAAARLTVVTRAGSDSRCGKGAALNAAYPYVQRDVKRRDLDPDEVVVAVMDADGRLSAGAVERGDGALRRPMTSAACNSSCESATAASSSAQFQDIEFWMISALSQFARSISGTVSLGGNGQFTRLSALEELDGEPWSRSLTEDLDLGLRLIAAGWQITTTKFGYVDQQAVDTFGRPPPATHPLVPGSHGRDARGSRSYGDRTRSARSRCSR